MFLPQSVAALQSQVQGLPGLALTHSPAAPPGARKPRKTRCPVRVEDYTRPGVRLERRGQGHWVPDRIFSQRDKASLATLELF